LFRDSDAGWHIRAGERILATGQLPRTDPYSFTRRGQPWFAWEWGADVAVGAVHRAAGLSGVALFYGAVIAVGVWMWFRLQWALGGNFLVACALAPLLLSTCNIHWLARPHTIGWLFLLGWVWWLERFRASGPERNLRLYTGGRQWLFAGAVIAVWANVHASFFLAPVIALIYVGARPPWCSRDVRLLAVTVFAGLINPYTWRLYGHVFRYLTDSDLLWRVGEFQPFNFQAPGAWQIVATVIVGMMGGAIALTQRRLEHFLLAVVFTAMSLRSARALPLAALVLLPIANRAITEILPFERFQAYCGRLRAIDRQFRGWAVAPAALAVCWVLLQTPALRSATGFAPDQFPVAAYEHIPAGARLYAPDKFGGYLIYRSNGTLPVFFDGRSDLYGAEFLKQYGRLIQLLPGWQDYWNSFHFSHALAPADSALVWALEQLGWKPVYQDQTAVLLAKNRT
ncbi:MAG TPA: hypothetical protein VGS58_19865, partial [Candidatus Sulfopaludibacter sp.]|nr:hypothetical protein [Candidatus Sulfopaludibacter sp.]